MVSQDEAIKILQDRFNKTESFKIYYTLRLLDIGRIGDLMILVMRACIVIREAGLKITTNLVSAITGKPIQNCTRGLHVLGDKKALTFKRQLRRYDALEWIVSPVFLKYYEDPNYSLEA